jgi:enoyl-CoA hydratase/carnithine racemase
MYDEVNYETTDDGIAIITIDRPDVYNAFTRTTILELNEAIRTAIGDDSVYGLVLAGTGDGFCAGADVSSMPDWENASKEEYAGYLWAVQNVVRQLRETGKPSIAAVDGPAIGAGCDFALACDVRIASPDALFREGFVRVGLVPGDGGAWLLPRLIGEARAKEYLLTGKDILAGEAVEIGLAVSLDDDPLAAAREFAVDLLDLPIHAVQRTNDLTDPSLSFEDYCERAIEYQWECIHDPEHHEAVAAFNENRNPEYDR